MLWHWCCEQWTWYEAVYLLVFETSATSTLFLTVRGLQQSMRCAACTAAAARCRCPVPPSMRIALLPLVDLQALAVVVLQVFYWAALSGDGNTRADNIMKHGTNNILILLDVLLSRNPFLSYHFWVGTCGASAVGRLKCHQPMLAEVICCYAAFETGCQLQHAKRLRRCRCCMVRCT
jgi:hypothetical protein